MVTNHMLLVNCNASSQVQIRKSHACRPEFASSNNTLLMFLRQLHLPTMKLTVSALLLSVTFATMAQAKIATFTYSGVVTKKGDIKCTGYIAYQVNDDGGAAPYKGYLQLDGCIGGHENLDDGVFSLAIDADDRTTTMTEISTGLKLVGSQGKHVGPVKPCTAAIGGCPPATTMTCYFGAGPDGTQPTTKDCGLT